MSLAVAVVANHVRRGGGEDRIILEIVRVLASKGHRVDVVSAQCDAEVLTGGRVAWKKTFRFPAVDLIGYPSFALAASLKLRKGDYDVVCTMGPCGFSSHPLAFYAAFTQVGWMARWGDLSVDPYRRAVARTSSWLESRALRRAALVMPMAESMIEEVRPWLRPAPRLIVVPGGVDLEEFPVVDLSDRPTARDALGIPQDRYVIALIGEHATGRKGLDNLARAVASGGDTREMIVVKGSGPAARTMAKMDRIGAGDSVMLLAHDLSVLTLYAACDVVAIPSIYEPFSLVAAEAASCGLPIILSDRAGASEVLGDACVMVDPTDVSSIRGAIDRLRMDPPFARSLGSKARIIAESSLTWAKVASIAADAIEGIAAENATSRRRKS